MNQAADSQLSLLGRLAERWEHISLPDADVRLCRNFLNASEAQRLFNALMTEVPWKQDFITMYGKRHPVPRLHQWYGEPGLTYRWSGITMEPAPWTPVVLRVREAAEGASDTKFNTVLLNYYRDGNDSVAFHADDEKELGEEPVIASVSLGAEREFLMRHNDGEARKIPDQSIVLPHGSLLLMCGPTQQNWKHSIPKRKSVKGARINLTFRWVSTGLPPLA